MTLSSSEWHQRFKEQAEWTKDLRQHLFARAGLQEAKRILDAGCGTGALFGELSLNTTAQVYGLDINRSHLALAADFNPQVHLIEADAHQLPLPDNCLDIVLCHFFFLWVADPERVVLELARATRPGGSVLALAEPDYGGRIDHPEVLQQLGRWQLQALSNQGADPLMGRRLPGLFHRAGYTEIEFGVLGGQWQTPRPESSWLTEWQILLSDLEELSISEREINAIKNIDALAWKQGERVLFVPTFYAWGKKT